MSEKTVQLNEEVIKGQLKEVESLTIFKRNLSFAGCKHFVRRNGDG